MVREEAINMDATSSGKTVQDDPKSRRKFWKQQKKLQKQEKKEEEFLKNLRKPKDTKVVLTDRAAADHLLGILSRNQQFSTSKKDAGFSADDFPRLNPKESISSVKMLGKNPQKSYKSAVAGSVLGRLDDFTPLKKKKTSERRTDGKEVTKDGSAVKEKPKTEESSRDNKSRQVQAAKADTENKAQRNQPKKRKKNDPIVVNFKDLIVTKPQIEKREKFAVYGSKYQRARETRVLYGNSLDSSNPKRYRGKHKENKKRKLTKLKFAIIRDRLAKIKARRKLTDPESETECEPTDLIADVYEYLKELTNKKSTTQLRKSNKGKTENVASVKENENPGEEKKAVEDGTKPAVEKRKNKKTKYRKYCTNDFNPDLDESIKKLVEGIVYLQDKAFACDPIHAMAKRRYVTGFREVKKYLMLKKIEIVIVAPDLEAQETVFNTVEEIKQSASVQNVPCIFALSRKSLGYTSKKKVPVSAFGILSYQGLENRWDPVKLHLLEAQEKWQKKMQVRMGDTASADSTTNSIIEKLLT